MGQNRPNPFEIRFLGLVDRAIGQFKISKTAKSPKF
jgi:hypothetical protein